jgi:hypothetical protein
VSVFDYSNEKFEAYDGLKQSISKLVEIDSRWLTHQEVWSSIDESDGRICIDTFIGGAHCRGARVRATFPKPLCCLTIDSTLSGTVISRVYELGFGRTGVLYEIERSQMAESFLDLVTEKICGCVPRHFTTVAENIVTHVLSDGLPEIEVTQTEPSQ